ncbi:MAG TPA: TMEM175 family protein, partial [Thermoanaerobaculia bacterium]|nr:TMEM175 family protein [Thermoanaerobaculia bacterium]
IGTYWASHHRLFRWIAGYDHALVWRNLLFLLAVSFIPFPTAFFSENAGHQTSLVVYAVCLILVGLAQVSILRHVRNHERLQHPATPPGELAWIQRRALIVPALSSLAIALSFVSLPAARLTLVAIPVAVRLSQRGLSRQT